MIRTWLVLCFAAVQMVSFAAAQDTIFVSCWTGKHSEVYRSKTVKGPVFESAIGEKAYVSTSAKASDGGCMNVTRLFVAAENGEFRKVFEARPIMPYDGNGMRLIGWNSAGTKLMAELGRFNYGSDVGMSREIIIFDATSAKISQFDAEAALAKYFGGDCAFDFETTSWLEPNSAAVRIREYKEDWDDNQKSCVPRPTRLAVNLSTGAVGPVPAR